MATRVIPLEQVIDLLPEHLPPSTVSVRRMAETLTKQGQIVPLVLTFSEVHDLSIVYAAVELGWPTLLVTDEEVVSG